jgi:UDP-3-O-[3-hydroxymyristoyl] glucosamine N-acyltransferase
MISDSVLIEAGTFVNRLITKKETYIGIPAKLNI